MKNLFAALGGLFVASIIGGLIFYWVILDPLTYKPKQDKEEEQKCLKHR